jgi:hypothetical protein
MGRCGAISPSAGDINLCRRQPKMIEADDDIGPASNRPIPDQAMAKVAASRAGIREIR